MSQISLDSLVAALASSVAEAEHVVRTHQLRNLRTFFNDDNKPVTVELQVPSVRSDAKPGEHDNLAVPLLTLINVSNMSIAEMEVTFSTSLGDVNMPDEEELDHEPMSFQGKEAPSEADIALEREEQMRDHLGWSASRDGVAIDVSTSPTTAESGRASVTLKVRTSETPEGLARLIARLNRTL